jgi:hypothetical protein
MVLGLIVQEQIGNPNTYYIMHELLEDDAKYPLE